MVCTLSSSEKLDRNRTTIALQPDVKLIPGAFRWALMCGLVGVESSSITVRKRYEGGRRILRYPFPR